MRAALAAPFLDQGRSAGIVSVLLEREQSQQDRLPSARSRLFVKGVLVRLLNPKIAVFFVAFLPQFVDPSHGMIALQTLILGTVFTLLAVLSDSAYALLAAAAGGWLRTGRRSRRWLAKVSGATYIGLGATAALSGAASGHSRPGSS